MIFSYNKRTIVRAFGHVRQKSGSWHKGRRTHDHLILYVTEGVVHIQIGSKEYFANVGDVLFISKGRQYKPLAGDACSYFFFHFEMEEERHEQLQTFAVNALEETCEGFAYSYEENFCDNTVKLDRCFTPGNQQTIREILLRTAKLDVIHDAKQKMFLDLYFKEFLVAIENARNSEKQLSDTVKKIVRYIHDNIKSPISLQTIAEKFYLSESYVARIFKKEMKESVGTYITKQKINLACALLMNSDISISEVARQVGYTNQYYFSSSFSKWTGLTPTAYRKQI